MIQAKVIADSLSPTGDRLTTLEVVMPRYILAEFNTHRMLSKNSASSRAIPFNKMIKNIEENPFIPYEYQKDHTGMQGSEYLEVPFNQDGDLLWKEAREAAIKSAKEIHNYGITKQLANRRLEADMYHKVLVSGTEWQNFFNLRCPQYEWFDYEDYNKESPRYYKSRKEWLGQQDAYDMYRPTLLEWLKINKGQADIHMMFLAEAIYDAINESKPKELKEGEWHIPYSVDARDENLVKQFSDLKRNGLVTNGMDAQLKISIARCARLSYQTLGDNPEINYEKDLQLYEVLSKSGHWSPFEHIAKVMTADEYDAFNKGQLTWDEDARAYIPHTNTRGWCNNFRGFIQQRYILEQEYNN